MMKLFKKKKSEKNLANAILLQDSRELDSSHVAKYHTKPASSMATIPVASTSTTLPNTPTIEERPPSPPLILMPKPRRPHTPTRALMGRYDHDKTQVEEDESSQFVHQQEISPILLPTPRELPLLPQLVKPVARHLPQQQAPGAVSSHSTIISDDSSRVYESALESLSDATEDDPTAAAERPVLPAVVKKKPSLKPIVNPLHTPLLPQQQLQQDIMAIGVISDSSSSLTASPQQQQQQQHIQKRSNAGSSANNVTPLQHDSKQTSTPKMASKSEQKKPQNQHVPPPQPAQRLLLDSLFEQQKEDGQAALLIEQQKKDEQTALLKELKRQVELIEKQRIKDREEWTRKEQELLSHRHQMMETLIETKEQLTSVLKSREEDHNNKAKLSYYDQQLKQQQLFQLQKQVAEMNLKHHHHHHHQQQQQQQQQEEGDDDEEEIDEEDLNANYYPQQFYPENDPDALLEKDDMGYDEAQMYHHRRMRNRSKSEDHIKHHSRSASRSSHHYQHADDGRRSSNSRSNYNGDDIPAPRKPVSRRASNASSKSIGGHRLDHTSPATTLVSSHSASKRRPRARSIESARWHEEQQMMMQMNGLPVYMDEMMVPYEKIRRSRSAGRDLHSMRPVSRASSAYNNPYYDDGDRADEELFDSHPTFYDNEYYSGHMDNIPPKQQQQQQQQQQMMPRYSHDIPYYPMPPQPHLSHQYLYSPADYYYQPPRHGQRYSSRHHYSYN